METSMIGRISRLRRMTVGDLQLEWFKTFGERPRVTNRDHLWKRLAWKVQQDAYGGLSERARTRIDELAPAEIRTRTVNVARSAANPAPPGEGNQSHRDPRLPSPGTVISKVYKGNELRVVIRDDGLELDGQMYASATALAKAVTGSKSINGWLFLGVARRKR